MAIRDVSGLPDDQVPAWVRRARELRREEDKKYTYYNVKGPDGKTQHQRDLLRCPE